MNIFVTPGGKRWKRAGSHIDIPVENGAMMTSCTDEQNSEAFERLTACLPYEGVPDRMWQGVPHSFSKDFIVAVDMDSDTSGSPNGPVGNQVRSTRIIGLSLICSSITPCAFGIYSSISYDVRLQDLYVKNVGIGYRTSDSWLQSWSNITVENVNKGFFC
ncbi:hypothetical protein NO393_14615 [Escherichia coli]|nr:hypothetical protein [Escherichia coli]